MSSWVLMYHRVCPQNASNAPWFARGTAVTPEALARQLDWVADRFEIVPLEVLIAARATPSRVAVTFDDGYRDVLAAAEICAPRRVSATCFAASAPVLDGVPLWFDVWYAIVAGGPAEPALSLLRSRGCPEAASLNDWITGLPRRWVEALATDSRERLLAEAATVAGACPPSYLRLDDLAELSTAGWTIGGHGHRHLRLPDCMESEVESEVRSSVQLLKSIGVDRLVFAYPDGAYDERVTSVVRAAGFGLACTVERGAVLPMTDPLRVPRLFCRGDSDVPHRALRGEE